MSFCSVCGGGPLRHFEWCSKLQGQGLDVIAAMIKAATDPLVARIVALEAKERDTIPAPPFGDSHSGAVVVPRGSSNPPSCETLVEVRADMPPGVFGVVKDSIVAIPGACIECRMLACACPVLFYPTDDSDGEGGP